MNSKQDQSNDETVVSKKIDSEEIKIDKQSIEMGLSTFSSHLINIKKEHLHQKMV